MPLYDFECPDCGAASEEVRSIADRNDPLTCSCGGSMCRVMSGGQFMLLGGGWSGGGFHPKIHPAKTDPFARKTPHDNYHNCTPESVRDAMNRR